MEFSCDPLVNAIYTGMKPGIEATLEGECYGSALILIYAGIHAMVTLGMPAGHEEVTRADFTNWVDRYIRVGRLAQVTAEEFYSARCGVVHNYGVESRLTRGGSARKIGYMVGSYPPVRYDSKRDPDLVLLDILAFAGAFFDGVDNFLIDMMADAQKKLIVEARLQKVLCTYEYGSQESDADKGAL